ncbi:MAG: hypothetical protein LC768_05630 [Acidobacteria bacterium]|nr:hypothetical protein [Acidobacteriota bacterium]MCA1637805.1 hypothetical protein [Acidobacteriota bacterium]
MKKQILKSFIFSLFAICLTATVNTNAQNRDYTATDRQVQFLLNRIQTATDTYKRDVDTALDRSTLNNTASENEITGYITDYETAVDSLKQKFDARQSTDADVEDVLNRATDIDQFMKKNRLTATTQRNWTSIRTDLNTLARYYAVSWNWNNAQTNSNRANINRNNDNRNNDSAVDVVTNRPYRVSEGNVQSLLTRLESRTDVYKREINTSLDRSVLNNTRSEEAIFSYITEFENATDKLKQNFDARRSTAADIEEVLNRAYFIDGFMRDYRMTATAENQWKLIRTDLDTLANNYNVSWNWNRQYVPTSKFDTMLSGTYRLNAAQSDNVSEVVDRAIGSFYRANQGNQGDRVRRNLERRLSSPDMLAIEKRDKQVTIASSMSPQISFDADGVAQTETTPNGRAIKVTAQTYYDGVALNYEGDRMNDFYVNFIPLSNGQLKVIRRVYLENRNDTVTVASVYDKVNNTANWSMVTNQNVGNINQNNQNNQSNQSNQDFVVPNNTRLTAVLNTPISTKTSRDGDRFTMEVTSPSQFNGAVIEGRVAKAQRSGTVSGRANVSLEFDTIRLRNGQTYRFAGIVDQVTSATGEKVTVNNEGTVRDNNQTTKTVTRAGIGAALGALIGAIAGGGQGAAIGAVVGAGAGAGTVIAQGKDDVELGQGTQIMITASAPNNVTNINP